MEQKNSQYSSSAAWREAAMQRTAEVNHAESGHRAKIATAHNQQLGISNADTLADQQLNIQGKMNRGKYQNYLLFKHANDSPS